MLSKDHDDVSLFADSVGADELRPFTPGEMCRCEECLRANPPTRVTCLYCSAPLPAAETKVELAHPPQRRLERSQPAYNNILISDGRLKPEVIARLADFLQVENDDAARIFSLAGPLPLARVATREEAAQVQSRLAQFGLQSMIISDQDLGLATEPLRWRRIELSDEGLLGFQFAGAPPAALPWADLDLVLTARLQTKQIEVREKRRRGSSQPQIVDASETMSDDSVVDLYARGVPEGYRIRAGGFDFGCLGDRKQLLARDNFQALLAVIRERAPEAEHDNCFVDLRRGLDIGWPAEQQTVSRGLLRAGSRSHGTGEVLTTSNEKQFTRYSRLRYFLKHHPPSESR